MHGNRRKFRLIGLTGAAGAGKDTVAEALNEISYVQYALAAPIKRALNGMFGWTGDQWQDREWKEKEIESLGFSPRRAAQTLGTEWGRALNEKLWLTLADFTLRFYESALERGEQAKEDHPDDEHLPHYVGMVVSDVRFENEAQWLREQGGEVWHIERPERKLVTPHVSEAGVLRQQHDIVLYNTGTIDGIKQAAKIIARGG